VTRRRFPLWIVLGVVLVVALAIGSGVFDSSPPTAAQRAQAIERGIKCPSCEDLSVADSSAETASIVRASIRQQIAQGRTDQQIRAYLADRYGSAIVLDPPASGLSLVVWVLPLVGGALAVGILITVLVRRSRSSLVGPAEASRAEAAADEGATADELDDRRRFLERSLADAYAEHQAGDLSDADYQTLRRRDTARLATLDLRAEALAAPAAVATGGPAVAVADDPIDADVDPVGAGVDTEAPAATAAAAPARAPKPRRSRRQRLFLGGGIAALGAALVLVVALAATSRLPGQTVSGNVALSQQAQTQQSLAQAAALVNEGQSAEAAQLYGKVLDQQPTNEVALAQLGWLEYETGVQGKSASLIASGRDKLTRAVKLAPDDYAGRLYLGTVLLQEDQNPAGAVAQYQAFLAAKPPADLIKQAASLLRQAYTEAGVPVPSQVPAG
jgi:cytochrome c-type biogenesis protein CcmH